MLASPRDVPRRGGIQPLHAADVPRSASARTAPPVAPIAGVPARRQSAESKSYARPTDRRACIGGRARGNLAAPLHRRSRSTSGSTCRAPAHPCEAPHEPCIRTGFPVLLLALGANDAGAHHSTAVFTMDKVVELRAWSSTSSCVARTRRSSSMRGRSLTGSKARASNVGKSNPKRCPCCARWESTPTRSNPATRSGSWLRRIATRASVRARTSARRGGRQRNTASLRRTACSARRCAACRRRRASAGGSCGRTERRRRATRGGPLASTAADFGTERRIAVPLNEAGLAARRAYDRKASPANTCEPMTVPDVYSAPILFDVD